MKRSGGTCRRPLDCRRAAGICFSSSNSIVIHHAREHNLKNIDLRIPHGGFTVITGVSGSGKSTLAFDIIFNEGQRRYLESLNAYARQFVQPASRPDVDAIYGIPPTVAIEQRTSRGGRKSTVATLTEIYHFLRLLFVKLGTQYCPDCDIAIEPQSADSIAARIVKEHRGRRSDAAGAAGDRPQGLLHGPGQMGRDQGLRRAACRRRAHRDRPNGRALRASRSTPSSCRFKLVSQRRATEPGCASCWTWHWITARAWSHVLPTGRSAKVQVFSAQRACPSCGQSFPDLDPRLFSYNSAQGWCGSCYGTGLRIERL